MKTVRPIPLFQTRRATRRGAVVLFALMALLLTSIIGGSLLRTALAQHRFALREQSRLQSLWLAESGVERAVAKLSLDPDYSGETWSLSASDVGEKKAAQVTVKIERVGNLPGRRTITVIADYPRDAPQRSRSRKMVTVDLDRT